jgi:hypothetical protein
MARVPDTKHQVVKMYKLNVEVNVDAFSAQFPYFENINVRLCDLHAVCLPVYPPVNFWMPEPVFMKLRMYVMAPEPISTAYFITHSH